jgi:hypothetical protein
VHIVPCGRDGDLPVRKGRSALERERVGLDHRFGHPWSCRVGTGFIVPTKLARMEAGGWQCC